MRASSLNPLRGLRNLRRLRQIAGVFARHGFGWLVDSMRLRRFVPLLRKRAAAGPADTAQRAATALQELGPTFVKLGQALSMRPDIVPESFALAFKRLQDDVAPFPAEQARGIIEASLGKGPEALFDFFEPEPVASGSIAQVHLGRLTDGRAVAVKIRRPGIEREIAADLDIMRHLAQVAERHIEEMRIYRPVEIVEELARMLSRELDLAAEAASTERFALAFKDDPEVVTPEVVWGLSGGEVLTLTRLEGVKLSDPEAPRLAGTDGKTLARRLADCFMKQFFTLGLFHADPHPGNLLALPGGRIGLLDFGAVGCLSDETATQLAAAVYALGKGDVEFLAGVYEEIGVFGANVERPLLLSDLQEMMLRYRGVPAGRLDVRKVFSEAVAVARRHGARLPRELVLFGKALVSVLSVAQMLDPELRPDELLRPYMRRLVLGRFSPSAAASFAARTAYHLGNLAKSFPADARAILRDLRRGRMRFAFRHEGLEDIAGEIDRALGRLAFAVVVGSIVIGSSFVIGAGVGPKWPWLERIGLGDVSLLGLAGFVIAGVLGIGLAWGIYRSGRLEG